MIKLTDNTKPSKPFTFKDLKVGDYFLIDTDDGRKTVRMKTSETGYYRLLERAGETHIVGHDVLSYSSDTPVVRIKLDEIGFSKC